MICRACTLVFCAALCGVIVACAGPENRDDSDPTATAVRQEQQITATPGATSTESAATENSSPTAEDTATATASPTATSSPTSEPPTPTPEPTPTATAIPVDLAASLPTADQLPEGGFFLANQGTWSALDLANFYTDSSAHLERLNNWGFKEHQFREYSRDAQSDAATTPTYVLTTVNEYGSDEQAVDAMDWLRSLNASQGQTFVDPEPELADGAFASSVQTAEGTATSIVYVQIGPRIYAYFGQGGEPLDFVLALAESNTQRIVEAGTEPEPEEEDSSSPSPTPTP